MQPFYIYAQYITIAAKLKDYGVFQIWGLHEQWSRYKENEVDKHRSF